MFRIIIDIMISLWFFKLNDSKRTKRTSFFLCKSYCIIENE